MGIWNSILNWLDASIDIADTGIGDYDTTLGCDINPASGLPMVGGCGGVDIEGNPYGTDFHHDDSWTPASANWDDSLASSSWDSGIGDSWDD